MWTVAQLAADLDAGRTSSRELVEQALARIGAPGGEDSRAFLKVHAESARADADAADRLRKVGVRRSAIDGLPVSLKDLFDVAGEITRAGSRTLSIQARRDAGAVARLRENELYKLPGVGETITWARALLALGANGSLDDTLGVALKVREDIDRVRRDRVLEGA